MKEKTYKFHELELEVQQQVVDCYIYNCDAIPEEFPEAYNALFERYDWDDPKENFDTYLCREIESAVFELFENSNKEFTKEGIDLELLYRQQKFM